MVIVEDETMIAAMFIAWLRRRPQFQVVGHATNGVQALELCRAQKPELAMVDVKLPGMDGLSLSEQVLEEQPQLKILIVSSCCDAYCLYRINQLGLHGFVDKMSPLAELETALTAVASGKVYFSKLFREQMERQLKQPDAFHKILSQREIEILHLLAMGLEDGEIAKHMAITSVTVQTHRRNIRRKLSVHSDRALMSHAQRLGLSLDRRVGFPAMPGGLETAAP
jgi:DNA-binding NarL/FixJ family response regulator